MQADFNAHYTLRKIWTAPRCLKAPVADLPAGYEGQSILVNHATATTPRTIVAGGGGSKVRVEFDGTNWLIV